MSIKAKKGKSKKFNPPLLHSRRFIAFAMLFVIVGVAALYQVFAATLIRTYQETDTEIRHTVGHRITYRASDGVVRGAWRTTPSEIDTNRLSGFSWYGPYRKQGSGWYGACFKMRAAGSGIQIDSLGHELGHVWVLIDVYRKGVELTYRNVELEDSDPYQHGPWETHCLNFYLPRTTDYLEFRASAWVEPGWPSKYIQALDIDHVQFKHL